MSQRVRVALAGISGYGELYLQSLLHDPRAAGIDVVAVADPAPQRCRRLEEVQARGIRVHPSLESLFSASAVELLIVSTPIHLHAPHTCFALEHGANVLCEKPLAGSMQDAARMAEAKRAAKGKFVAIGYQWCFSDAVAALKRDIMDGALGKAVAMKSIVFMPRARSYFRRNDWAGRIRSSGGAAVLDSPANNAAAHHLQHMLYLLGGAAAESAMPASVQAELYRANEIENYDTVAMRVKLAPGCELLFYATHAVSERLGPLHRLEFEKAVVEYDAAKQPRFVARFRDGTVRDYGDPDADPSQKIWQCAQAVRSGAALPCGIAAATPQTACVVAAQRSPAAITEFPQRMRQTRVVEGREIVCVDGLTEALIDCYERGMLPAENGGFDWSTPGEPIAPL